MVSTDKGKRKEGTGVGAGQAGEAETRFWMALPGQAPVRR